MELHSLSKSFMFIMDRILNDILCRVDDPKTAEIHAVSDDTCNKMTLEYIIKNTNDVAIGPLEYCGNGHIVKRNGGGGEL